MDRIQWGPGPEDVRPVIGARMAFADVAALRAAVEQVSSALGVPVQLLRQDRVVSRFHLDLAAWHAARAARDGRARSEDPALEFLLYAAADRQIHRAIADLGVPFGSAVPLWVVALGPVDEARLASAVEEAWRVDATRLDGEPPLLPDACRFWADRLGGESSMAEVEASLAAAMADLAVDRL